MYIPERLDEIVPRHVVILRALPLGDLLTAVPAFRALRGAFPDACITLVSLPWAREFVERFHTYLDHFIPFPGLPEQSPDIRELPAFLLKLQKSNFDLAIQMQGSGGPANSLISLWGAKRCVGFYKRGDYCPNEDSFLEYPEHEPEVWRHLRLMQFLEIPLQGDELEFPLFEEDYKAFHRLKEEFSLMDNYVCIHPGARAADRRWSPHQFAQVADGLAALGHQIVLTGSQEESPITESVAGLMEANAINLAGKTDLGTLAVLISQARLLICNDTGVSHLASATQTRSLILFTASDPNRWAPQNKDLHYALHDAMTVTAPEVLAQAVRHLERACDHVC